MPLVSAKCTNCGANLVVDNSKDAWICNYCQTPFIVEKAINNYNITNNNSIHAETVNIYGGNGADFVIRGGVLEKYNGASTKVVIPNTVTHIQKGAFKNCIGITEVTIPDSVIEIGDEAFQCCSSLRSVIIPDSVKKVGCGVFEYCTDLESAKLSANVKEYIKTFFGCSSLKSVEIPEGVTDLSGSFGGCKIKSIKLPSTLRSLDGAFTSCTSLESITIPYGVEKLNVFDFYYPGKSGTFSDCINLKSIVIPDTVTFIYEDTFYRCQKLTNIEYKYIAKFAHCFPVINYRKNNGLCIYCGGKLSLLGKCKDCGRKRDY